MAHQLGDIVELISGSPKMTVSSVDDHDITVKWYDTISGSVKSTHGPHIAFKKAGNTKTAQGANGLPQLSSGTSTP